MSLFGLPYLVKENPLQNWHHLGTFYSIHTLAAVTNIHHNKLLFSNEFQWVLSLYYIKKNNRALFFGAHCKCSSHIYTAAKALFSILVPAFFVCYLSVTLQTMSITAANFQNNHSMFYTFSAFVRFTFDSPYFKTITTNLNLYIYFFKLHKFKKLELRLNLLLTLIPCNKKCNFLKKAFRCSLLLFLLFIQILNKWDVYKRQGTTGYKRRARQTSQDQMLPLTCLLYTSRCV